MQMQHLAQCRDYYHSIYQSCLQDVGDAGNAMDACLQRFLNQRPNGKHLTSKTRAKALISCAFWSDSEVIDASEFASLALSKVLHYDDVLPEDLAIQLASHNPESLRWAIRYSGLFERKNSSIWQYLRTHCTSDEWPTFFGVCDRLLEQLEPFDRLIDEAELALKSLSLVELLSYLSILASFDLVDPTQNNTQQRWDVYDRIIHRKLKICKPQDFRLNEQTIGKSLKRHMSPLLFPSGSGWRAHCVSNLEALAILIEATSERIDYEGSIDWFRFNPLCHYRMVPGESVIYNLSDEGTRTWERTEQKYQLLWHYWMNRAIATFAETDLVLKTIGSPDNHEANQLAYIKAMRSMLLLNEIYGLDGSITLEDGTTVPLFQLLLASELTSIFFDLSFIQPFRVLAQETKGTVEALGAMALEGLMQGENRFPMTWSTEAEKARRIKGWTVSDEHPNGRIENARAILRFWSNDLKMLSSIDHSTAAMNVPRLTERPYCKIGNYSFQFPWVTGQQNNLTSAVNNLRRLGARRSEVQAETRRVEQRLGELFEMRGFKVIVGYQPPVQEKDDAGEIDLICHLDGTVLLLEVKSGYIRRSTREVWLHRTSTLRKAAWQLARKREALVNALEQDENLRLRLGYPAAQPHSAVHSWIVDTSIELDGQVIDGFPVVCREALEVILREEKHLLRPLEELEPDQTHSLFPNGFNASRLVEIVETGALWEGLDEKG